MSTIAFHVRGQPIPQGSMIKGRWGGIHSDNPKTLPWREDIRRAAAEAMDNAHGHDHIYRGAVSISAIFILTRPKTLAKKWTSPVSKPDVDKLCRALLDAMTGVVYVDDSQVTALNVGKIYGAAPGVNVTVLELDGGKPR